MYRALAVLSLAACSPKSVVSPPATAPAASAPSPATTAGPSARPSAPAPPAPVAPPEPVARCIARDTGAVDNVTITPTTVDFCAGAAPARSCWHVDVATKQVEARTMVAPSDPISSPRNVTRNADGTVTLCPQPGKCTTVKPTIKIGETDALGSNADGSILARIPEDQKSLELYDVATWKRRAKIAPWNTAMGRPALLVDWTFAGPNIIAWASATPISSQGRIFTLAGKRVGEIGDKDFSQNVLDSWPTTDTTWLFKQLDDTRLIAVDVATGKLVKTYNLASMAANTDDPTVSASGVASTADTIAYLSGSGVVGVITRATGAIEVLSPPRCPTP